MGVKTGHNDQTRCLSVKGIGSGHRVKPSDSRRACSAVKIEVKASMFSLVTMSPKPKSADSGRRISPIESDPLNPSFLFCTG